MSLMSVFGFQLLWILSLLRETHTATYERYSSNNDFDCAEATVDDTCILHCDNALATTPKTFDCGLAHDCYFHCDKKNCLNSVTLGVNNTVTASSSTNLYAYANSQNCLEGADIFTATYSYFGVGSIANSELYGMNIHSDPSTQVQFCTSTGSETCTGIMVNAQSVSLLEIVADVGTMRDAVVYCPQNSNYNGPLPAPCTIDFSGGGIVDGGAFHTANGMPTDLVIYGELRNTVTVYCSAGSSVNVLNSFEGQGDCWITSSPTSNPSTAQPSAPPLAGNPSTVYPSSSPSSYPSSTPTESPIATSTPTESPISTLNPTNQIATSTPTESPISTSTPTESPIATSTPTESPISTSNPTESPRATWTSTVSPLSTPTASPSLPAPTSVPTLTPIYNPTSAPMSFPTASPIIVPTSSPSPPPPTSVPTLTPIYTPTSAPVHIPTATPIDPPTSNLFSSTTSSTSAHSESTETDSLPDDGDGNTSTSLMGTIDIKIIIIIILCAVICVMLTAMYCRYRTTHRKDSASFSSRHRTNSQSDASEHVHQRTQWTDNTMAVQVAQLPKMHLNEQGHSGSLSKSIKKKAHNLSHPHPQNPDFMRNLTDDIGPIAHPKYALQPPHITLSSVTSHDFNIMPSHQASIGTATVNTSHDLNAMPSVASSVTEDEEATTPLVQPEHMKGEESLMTLGSEYPVLEDKDTNAEMEGVLDQMADASSQKSLELSPNGRRNVFKPKMMDASSGMNVLDEKQEYEDSEISDVYTDIMQKYQSKSVDAASNLSLQSRISTPGKVVDGSSKMNILQETKEHDDDEVNHNLVKYTNIAQQYQSKSVNAASTSSFQSRGSPLPKTAGGPSRWSRVKIHEDNEIDDDIDDAPNFNDASSETNR